LFVSVILHELGHAVVARRFGVTVRSIRLFIFGGVAEMASDPKKPGHELLIAVAGPAVTLVLILLFNLVFNVLLATSQITYTVVETGMSLQGGNWLTAGSAGLLFYLSLINTILLLFNLVPAFPLDGGRVLRAILWATTGSYLSATRIAGAAGIGFSYLLFFGGIMSALGGNLLGGLWFFFLGMFLQNAAQSSVVYAQLQQLLQGVTVAEMMCRQPVAVRADQPLSEIVDQYFLKFPYKAYPVIQDGRFQGMVTLRALQQVPRENWPAVRAGELAGRQGPSSTLRPQDPLLQAMQKLAESRESRLPVLENGSLVGLLCGRDIIDFLQVRAGLNLRHEGLSPASSRRANGGDNQEQRQVRSGETTNETLLIN
jgi:Zn-dependent protease/CBS domain-containing protein